MRFRRDLPALRAGFGALGVEGWKNLVEGTQSKHAGLIAKAWPIFISEYFPEETAEAAISPEAGDAYLAWHKAGKVPPWVDDLGLYGDMVAASRGAKK